MKLTALFFAACPLALVSCSERTAPYVAPVDDAGQTAVEAAEVTHVVALEVTGMSCDGCAHSVRGALEALPGVAGCDVDFETGKASVHCTEAVEEDKLIASLEEAGFGGRKAAE